jgi:hypothetical protein
MQLAKLPCLFLLRSTIRTGASFSNFGVDTAVIRTCQLLSKSAASSNINHRAAQRRVSSLFTATTDNIDNMTADERQMFGRFKIASSQIFYRSKYSFAMVNLRPLVPGHVLVVSNRIVPLLSDLDCEL